MSPYILYVSTLWCMLAFAVPSWAADLTIQWTTAPGDAASTELAVWGEGAKGPDDPKAIRITAAVNTTSRIIKGADIDAAFPGTAWVGFTARKKGDQVWWAHRDGTYSYRPWPTAGPVVVDPPVVAPPPDQLPVVPPVMGITKEEVLALFAERDKAYCAACAARNKAMTDALDLCVTKKQTLKTCMTNLRDAIKKVSP